MDYFDRTYFDPAYFDTDDVTPTPTPGGGGGGRKKPRRRPIFTPQPDSPRDPEDWTVLIL